MQLNADFYLILNQVFSPSLIQRNEVDARASFAAAIDSNLERDPNRIFGI